MDAPDPPLIRKRLRRRPLGGRPDVRILSAGGIIYRNRGGRIRLFFVKDPFGRWSFPKGKVELGESLAQTAVREIREETGLDGLKLIAPLGNTMFRFWREAGLIEKTVYMFLFKAPPNAKDHIPPSREVLEGAWMPVHVAFQVSGYRNSDRMLGEAMRLISKEEGAPWVEFESRTDLKKPVVRTFKKGKWKQGDSARRAHRYGRGGKNGRARTETFKKGGRASERW